MVDYVTPILLASSGFFAALSAALLYRYRQISVKMTESTDLGRDLWASLEQRLKKQDERILDVMARLEVVQSRVLTHQLPATPQSPSPVRTPTSAPVVQEGGDVTPPGQTESKVELHHVASSRKTPVGLDETQAAAVKLLGERAMSTREITDALHKSREHTARIMKALFEQGLVVRDDSKRPFVYELTDEGKRYLSAN